MKKVFMVIIAMTLLVVGTVGCANDEPPPTPPVESQAEETQPLGAEHTHTWIDATCQSPRVCADCGETDGEPLLHNMREANFQEPSKCIDCGEEVGEPLPAAFPASGFALRELGVTHQYVTANDWGGELPLLANLTVSDVMIIHSDEKREAREGYEWQVVRVHAEVDVDQFANFRDEDYGIFLGYLIVVDYYLFLDMETTVDWIEDDTFVDTINFYGVEHEIQAIEEVLFADWVYNEWIFDYWVDDSFVFVIEYSYLVPIGYNGVMIAFFNTANSHGGEYDGVELYSDVLDEDTLFFRLLPPIADISLETIPDYIYIRDMRISTSETELELSGHLLESADIEQLRYMTNLRVLDMSIDSLEIYFVMFVAGGLHDRDLSPLAGLRNLTRLNLGGNHTGDLSYLTELTNLRELILWGNDVTDLSPLAGLTNLTHLDLSFNNMRGSDGMDLSPLAGLTNLTHLNLRSNNLSNISTLADLPALRLLSLYDNPIENWSYVDHVDDVRR